MNYLKIALALALFGAGVTGVLSYRHLAAKAATADARIAAAEQKAEANARTLATLQKEMVRRAEFDQAIRDTRAQINGRLDDVQKTDPVARDYLGERIPDSVRHAIVPPVRDAVPATHRR